MQACSIIFWSVVVPVLTFGAKIWHLNNDDIESILSFQKFAGRRVQRFPPRSPKSSSFYGLGWIKLTTYIAIKRLLFILSIIRLDDENIIRKCFINSFNSFKSDVVKGTANVFRSPVYEMCKTCTQFGLLNTVEGIIVGNHPIPSKRKWAELVWGKGWELDDNYWRAVNTMNKENELLNSIMEGARYLVWWQLATYDKRM